MIDLLDNPIWNALDGEQRRFGERAGDAARFDPAVTLLAGFRHGDATPAAQAALAGLLGADRVGVFLPAGQALDPSLEIVDGALIAQMVHDGVAREASEAGLVALGDDDSAQMMALAALTKPGPFGPRTHQLGDFLGVKVEAGGDRLVAMAGQRMRLPGMIEISAVCTHPDFAGRGHGGRLMAAQLARICGLGARAFLHVRADNAGAIGLYQKLGFAIRREFRYAIVRGAR